MALATATASRYFRAGDDGCSFHPTCQTCPFLVCLFEQKGEHSVGAITQAMVDNRVPDAVICEHLSLSMETLRRWKATGIPYGR